MPLVDASSETARSREELQALIEAARRRVRRRRASYAALMLLVLGIAGGIFASFGGGGRPGSSHGTQGGEPARAATPASELQAIEEAAQHGVVANAGFAGGSTVWAANGLGLWLTESAGSRWQTVTPPDMTGDDPVARIGQVQFVNPDDGWMSASDIPIPVPFPDAATRHLVIEHTTNAGKSWRPALLPGCADCGGAWLSFLNAKDGFALTGLRQTRLYRTTNGGITWKQIAMPRFSGPIVFTSMQDGFGTRDHWLYRTHDGGHHWQQIALPKPTRYAGDPPTVDSATFFNRRDGVVPVRYLDKTTKAQHLVIYSTRNGGSTWTAHLAPASANVNETSCCLSNAFNLSAPTPTTWIFLANNGIYSTRNAGQSWALVRPRYAPANPRAIWFAGFTSTNDGWAVFSIKTGPVLVHTDNAGLDWTPRQPPMHLPPPPKQPQRCGSACRRP